MSVYREEGCCCIETGMSYSDIARWMIGVYPARSKYTLERQGCVCVWCIAGVFKAGCQDIHTIDQSTPSGRTIGAFPSCKHEGFLSIDSRHDQRREISRPCRKSKTSSCRHSTLFSLLHV